MPSSDNEQFARAWNNAARRRDLAHAQLRADADAEVARIEQQFAHDIRDGMPQPEASDE